MSIYFKKVKIDEYFIRICIVFFQKVRNDNNNILIKKCELTFIRSTLLYDFKSTYSTFMVNYGFSSTIENLTIKSFNSNNATSTTRDDVIT